MMDGVDLTAHLLALAQRQPARPALLAPGRATMSFGALGRHIERTAAQLAQWGIGRGDVVAWANGDRAETAAALAILPVSATIAPLAPRATFDALCDLLRRLAPKAVVVPAHDDAVVVRAARLLGLATLTTVPGAHLQAGAFDLVLQEPTASLDRATRFPASYACIGATSGATGKPKLVSHGHRQILRTAFAVGERLGLGPDDIAGHVTPLHLAGGMRNAYFQVLVNGGGVNCLPEAEIEPFLDAVGDGDVTYTSTSFAIHREILARLEAGRRYVRGRLRCVRIASGRMEPGELDRLERALDVPVVTGLASSETGTTAQQSPRAGRKRGSVGPVVDSDIRIVDADGRIVAPGEAGELQVRGPQLFDGYIDDDALNAASFVEGWYRTGDVVRIDDDGDLFIVGRTKDVISRGGDKIAPLEIDAVLLAQPGVADAAAFGVPHPRLGEEVVAAVVLEAGVEADAEAILGALRETLGARRAPRRLWFVASLPRTDVGKLQRTALPDWVGFRPAEDAEATRPAFDGSPLEHALAPLWASVLACDRVARDAAFYAQGGDDERAARLVAQVGAVFGVALPPDALRDEAATLAAMARLIERARAV